MLLKVTSDNRFLQIIDGTQNEIEQIIYSLTKKVDNYFIIKKKRPNWDGEVKFIDRFHRIPIGLWLEVFTISKKFNFPVKVDGIEKLTDTTHDFAAFNTWALEYFRESSKTPRDYQLEGSNRVLKFKNCTEEISTSGGKTLIAFLIFKYLLDVKKKKKFLYIVPNIGLVTQSEEKFYEYEDECNKKPNWKSQCAFGGARVTDDANINITFGTYQTLSKKPLEFFTGFDVVCVDECLHPDTLITMADFTKKKICDIEIGELVWTINETTGILEIKEVEFIYKNLSKDNQMFELEMEDGSLLNITGNHKVYTKENGWVRVDELTEKMEIISFNMMNI